MEAKDLMIGNLVNAVVTNGIETIKIYEVQIFEILHDGIRDINGLKFGFINLVGVSITKEILLNLGFERSKGDIQNENDSIYRLRDSDDESFYISFGETPMICIDGFGGLHYVDYVHELQNLYFTLGIQELKLKQS